MKPAFSIVVHTTLSGAGYGMLFWLGIYAPFNLLAPNPESGAVTMTAAIGLIAGGLIASLFHLGHPQRIWRTFTRWRHSWLSREAIASTLTFVPAIIFGLGWAAFDDTRGFWALNAACSAGGALLTVTCAAFIYRSLKPIPQWHNAWVVPNFLALSGMSGALMLNAILETLHAPLPRAQIIVLLTIGVALAVKLGYWRSIDSPEPTSTPESATGLGFLGRVGSLEAPHTSENYLLKEMGFQFAREHANVLRRVVLLLAYLIPFALTSFAFIVPGQFSCLGYCSAASSAVCGLLIERWLFFAEARHAVMHYYGPR